MALYSETVDLSHIDDVKHLFTESAKGANIELGNKMVELTLESMERRIKKGKIIVLIYKKRTENVAFSVLFCGALLRPLVS